MNKCQHINAVVKRMCNSSGVWENIVNTCNINRSKTVTESVSFFGSINVTSANMYASPVTARNGCLYFAPRNATNILKIDPATDTVTTFGSFASGGNKYRGGVLAPNGCIYVVPRDATNILKIDPATDTVTTFGSFASSGELYYGGVLAPNGCIYGIPANATNILKIDPATDTVTTFGSFASSVFKWVGGVLSPNGYIYGLPLVNNNLLRIDCYNNSYSLISTTGASEYYNGGIGNNGAIYIPASGAGSQSNIQKIATINNTFINFKSKTYESPYLNKF